MDDLIFPSGRAPLLTRLGKNRIFSLRPTVPANVALAAVAVGQTGEALAMIEAVQRRWAAGADWAALGRWAEVALLAGRPDLADAFAGHALDEVEESSGYGVDKAIWACAVAGRIDDALRLAALRAGRGLMGRPAVARAAEAMARSGNEAAARQILTAVRTDRVGAGGLAEVAKVFALRRDIRAAERCVGDLDDDADKAEALAGVACVAAVTSNPEAWRLASQSASVAYRVVDAVRAVDVQTAIATALSRTGHHAVGQQWVAAAKVTAQGRDDAGRRGMALGRVALALTEAGRPDDANRMALAALEAAKGPAYSKYLKGSAFAEAARALAVTGHHDQAHDAAGTAGYGSMMSGARFYTWWTRTLVVVLVHLSTTGHHDFAVRLAESLTSENWRHWTLAAIERQKLTWSGHDWREALGQTESIPAGIVDPNGQEEALRQIAEGLGTAVAAGGSEAEAMYTALRRVAAQWQSWTDLLPVIAVAEPMGIPDIAQHAAKAWPPQPHSDSRSALRYPEVSHLFIGGQRGSRWDVLRGRPLRAIVQTEV